MSKTDRRTWKRTEGPAAGDPPTEVLFIRKHPSRHTTWTLYNDAKERAMEQKKVPVLCLPDEQRDGFLVVLRADDFIYLAALYLAIIDHEERADLDALVEEVKSQEKSAKAGLLRVAGEED
jgi:hypothetical protein